MIFTGKNLVLLRHAMDNAVTGIQMHIGSCPDVVDDDLVELEAEKAQYEKLLARIDSAIQKERAK